MTRRHATGFRRRTSRRSKKRSAYLEEGATTRRGKNGLIKEPAQLVIATFEHGTSRTQDPQLHTHCLILNIAVRADGTTGSLESQHYYRSKMVAGALYRAELAYQLQQLGFDIERQKNSFEIAGVPAALMEEFSKRRAEIEARLDANGKDTARAAAVAALATREVKEHRARQELFAEWGAVGAEHRFRNEQAQGLRSEIKSPSAGHDAALQRVVKTLGQEAIAQISEEKSHFAARDLLRTMAEAAPGSGLSAAQLRTGVAAQLQEPGMVRLGEQERAMRYTTRELWEVEKSLLTTAVQMKAREQHPVEHHHYLAGMLRAEMNAAHKARESDPQNSRASGPSLSTEQRAALAHLTKNTGDIAVLSGIAGTGKTFLLDAAREAWQAQGYQVRGAAVAGKAARGLEEGAGIPSMTLARLLRPEQSAQLTSKTVLVVDEASMIGTRQMAALLRVTDKHGCKLVLGGDRRQLPSVEVGGPLPALEKQVGKTELTTIVRQNLDRQDKNPHWKREVVQEFAAGRADRALRAFAERGLLTVAADREAAKMALIAAWQGEGVKAPEKNVIFAGTRAEARALNRLAQSERQRAGQLGFRQVQIGGEVIHEKDRVLFTKNSAVLGVQNGSTGTVGEVDQRTATLTVKLDDGKQVFVPYRDYEDISLGYALTTHKGQGLTVKNAYVLCGGPMADRELSYVQASRARDKTELFTARQMVWNPATQRREDQTISELVRQMSQSRQKDLAHDVAEHGGALPPQPNRIPEQEPALLL